MTVTLTSTTKVVKLNGMDCRVWEGRTAKGIKCHAFIPRIAVHKDDDAAEFEAELEEKAAPSADLNAIPLANDRMTKLIEDLYSEEKILSAKFQDRALKAEKRIAELEAQLADVEKRAAFGDQCWQDRCENAYVEQSVVKQLEAQLAEARKTVEANAPQA